MAGWVRKSLAGENTKKTQGSICSAAKRAEKHGKVVSHSSKVPDSMDQEKRNVT